MKIDTDIVNVQLPPLSGVFGTTPERLTPSRLNQLIICDYLLLYGCYTSQSGPAQTVAQIGTLPVQLAKIFKVKVDKSEHSLFGLIFIKLKSDWLMLVDFT